MKQTMSIFMIAVILYSCGNSAVEQAKQVQSAIKENIPGTVATTTGGYTMKAKVDGKDWTAGSMMPPEAAGRIIGYFDEGEYIGLPYSKSSFIAGKKNVFGENYAV